MNDTTLTPVRAVEAAFQKGHCAFMPYFTLGYPDHATSLDVIEACAANGADLMELGVPFSDPLADGPTIQLSTQTALENGMSVAKCLDGVRELRARGVDIPLILMGYINPMLAYGLERFVAEASEAGANGFIVPDLPPDEAEELIALCREHGLASIFLLAPNSAAERIALVSGASTGFVYLVSVLGITGARDQLPDDLRAFAERVKAHTALPVAVGFGIATPAQAASVAGIADGVIVGSALIRAVSEADDAAQAAGAYVRVMADATHEARRR
jgi:tryptophan synthase alpha chain